jgi:hypothetical protein
MERAKEIMLMVKKGRVGKVGLRIPRDERCEEWEKEREEEGEGRRETG